MKLALERYESAINDLQGIRGLPPEEAAATPVRLQAYFLMGQALISAGNPSGAIDAIDLMVEEYGEVWGEIYGERALVEKANALALTNRASDAVTILTDIIELDGPGKGFAQEALNEIRQEHGSIKLSCDVLARSSEGAIRKARISERTEDWYDAIRALHDACDACLADPKNLREFGANALMNLGHCFAQLDRPYEAALAYERGNELTDPHYGTPGWPEDLDAADFLYYAYVQWKKLGNQNPDYADRGQETRDKLARVYKDSEQVKELTYYMAWELMGDAQSQRRQKKLDEALGTLRDAINRFSQVRKDSRKYEATLFLIGRARYELVNTLMEQQKVRRGRQALPPDIEQEAKTAVDAFLTYRTYLETAPPAITEKVLADRAYNNRWTSYYLGRLAYYRQRFEEAVGHYQAARSEDDPDFSAKCDQYAIQAQLAAGLEDEAEAAYQTMKSTYDVMHKQVALSALELAKHFDNRYLKLNAEGREDQAQDAELKSAEYFYDYAQAGTPTADNLLNISQKFLKVADDYREAGNSEAAEDYYRKAIWCIDQYLQLEEDPAQKATIEEQKVWIQYYLGDDQQAAPAFQRLVEARPERADVRLALGWCLVGLGEYDEALAHFEEVEGGVERFSPSWILARYGIAYCLAKKNPTPQDSKDASANGMKASEWLGFRGSRMIKDMRQLIQLGKTPEGDTIYFRDPDDPRRRVKPLGELWRRVELLLRQRR
jgi:tetratricopeptide (TPR) repeat protein